MGLVDDLINGDRKAAAKLITIIENDTNKAREIIPLIYPCTGNAHVIGVTGPPGAGKSALIEKLTGELRRKDKTVGIIAVDPTSPFTGGALLGDRIRMQELSMDKGVFIRSMGTRGNLGGLARATNDVIRILDAFGRDVIIIETVGAGQADVDIMHAVHTSVIVMVPGMGDDIQAIKAGILEIGDIFVVNKADKNGVDRTVMELEMMLDISDRFTKGESTVGARPKMDKGWRPPVIKTIATSGVGVPDLQGKIEEHMEYMRRTNILQMQEKKRIENELMAIIRNRMTEHTMERIKDGEYDELVQKVVTHELDSYSAADEILRSCH
jgi:LAO/AO transport system kinase